MDNASGAASRKLSAGMSRALRAWARVLGGVAILAVLIWRLGTGPFLEGVRAINGWSLAAAAGIAVLSTICMAWRWCLVARGLGVGLPLRIAIAAYYQSQFLNTALPGGVLGDVHRAVHHGLGVDDVGRGLRAVAWERFAGQFVQVVLTIVVLLALPSPVHLSMPVVLAVVAACTVGTAFLIRALPHDGPSQWARTLRAAGVDIRDGLLALRSWPGIVFASTVAVAGHTAMFLVAARTAGSTASPIRILPLALLILLASALPTNIGGWGPREGVAAWAFGVAGLGSGQGIATTVVYGVMVFVASLPGAAVMVVAWLRQDRRRPDQQHVPAASIPESAAHG